MAKQPTTKDKAKPKTDSAGRTALSRARTEATQQRERAELAEKTARDVIDACNKERIESAAKLSKVQTERDAFGERAERLSSDNNALRDMLYASEMECARMRGYLDALDDAKPVQPIYPEPERMAAKFSDGSNGLYPPAMYAASNGYNDRRSRPWFHSDK